jgi:hypothetical protein
MAEMVTVVRAIMRQTEVTTCGVPTMVRLPALARLMRCSGDDGTGTEVVRAYIWAR